LKRTNDRRIAADLDLGGGLERDPQPLVTQLTEVDATLKVSGDVDYVPDGKLIAAHHKHRLREELIPCELERSNRTQGRVGIEAVLDRPEHGPGVFGKASIVCDVSDFDLAVAVDSVNQRFVVEQQLPQEM
jgi:hypothetical protein